MEENKKNISISSIKKKNLNFHSRFDAKKRTYKYMIVNRKNFLVLDKNRAWLVKKKLNVKCSFNANGNSCMASRKYDTNI